MYPNENNIQRGKLTKINLLFRTEMNSLDHSSCFILYIHGVSQNILLQSGKHKWELSTHLIWRSVCCWNWKATMQFSPFFGNIFGNPIFNCIVRKEFLLIDAFSFNLKLTVLLCLGNIWQRWRRMPRTEQKRTIISSV